MAQARHSAPARLMRGKSNTLLEGTMIAGAVRQHNLTVVTRNIADFESFGVEMTNPFKAG